MPIRHGGYGRFDDIVEREAAPTLADIPLGQAVDWHDTAAGTVQRWANIGGTPVALGPAVVVTVGGGGSQVAQENRPIDYGWVYQDSALMNGWREGDGAGLPVGYSTGYRYTVTFDLENNPIYTTTDDRWTNLRAIHGSAIGLTYTFVGSGFGAFKLFNPTPWPLDEFEWIVFACRAPAASHPILVWLGDATGARVNAYKQITPKHDSLNGFGGLRHHAIHIQRDLGFTRPFPAVQTLTFENAQNAATGQFSIDEVRFIRALPRDVPGVPAYPENRPAPGLDPANRGGVFGGHSVPGGAWSCGNTPFNYVPAVNPRPANIWATGGKSADAKFKPYADLIGIDPATGQPFLPRGTTREILVYLSRKWGFESGYTDPVRGLGPPSLNVGGVDMIQGTQAAITLGLFFAELAMGQSQQETGWNQHFQSDPTTLTGSDLTFWGLSANGWIFDSYGIGQQRWRFFNERKESYNSTAWGAELKIARIKAAINGDITGAESIAGNIRKILAWYFSGSLTASVNYSYAVKILGGTSDSGPEHPLTNYAGYINSRDWTIVDAAGNPDWPTWNPNGSY
jgi:hypothetical protein